MERFEMKYWAHLNVNNITESLDSFEMVFTLKTVFLHTYIKLLHILILNKNNHL